MNTTEQYEAARTRFIGAASAYAYYVTENLVEMQRVGRDGFIEAYRAFEAAKAEYMADILAVPA